jgi:SAM-dependent methyltransferase
MESPREGERLLAQESAHSSRSRVVDAGIRRGDRALDAGCGAGAVTANLLELVGPEGHVTAFDPSEERVALARKNLGVVPNLELRVASLPHTGLPAERFDFVWSQFVFEYLADPLTALDSLKTLARPGGKVAIAEIDGYGLGVWPASERLTSGLELLQGALRAAHFDLFIGRKLFSLFRKLGFRDIGVRLSTFHVTPGAADDAMLTDWKVRFGALQPLGVQAFGSAAKWNEFTAEYLETLSNPDALKYSVVLTTVGTRP